MKFHEKMQILVEKSGYKTDFICEKLKIHRNTFFRWKSGKRFPNLEDFRNLCLFFGVSADFMLDLPEKNSDSAPPPLISVKFTFFYQYFWLFCLLTFYITFYKNLVFIPLSENPGKITFQMVAYSGPKARPRKIKIEN